MSAHSLNPAQERAVKTTQNHVLVLAGAGSGKTRVIANKYIYLTEKISPKNILAITFTNKAAAEMRERIKPFLPSVKPTEFNIKTFHAFGAYFLRLFIGQMKGYDKNFTIIDDQDQKKIIKEITKKYQTGEREQKIFLKTISSWKNHFLYPFDEEKLFDLYRTSELSFDALKEYKTYQIYLNAHNLVDFDDLITLPILLLKEHQNCQNFLKNWQHVLIDEYQDTNVAQEKLIEWFEKKDSILTAVGDDAQSIYSFRGANIENILNFEKKYPNVQLIKLEENYRSTQSILSVANDIIKHNTEIYQKKLFTKKKKGDLPEFYLFSTAAEEAIFVAEKIKKMMLQNQHPQNIAIFFRTNYQTKPYEDLLLKMQIPYQIIGSVKFFQRKEIKELIAYLNLSLNPKNIPSLLRVINFPPRGIGVVTIEKVIRYMGAKNLSILEILEELSFLKSLKQKAKTSLLGFKKIILELSNLAKIENVFSFINTLLKKSGLLEHYKQLDDLFESDQRIGNLVSFLETAKAFENNQSNLSVNNFAEEIALRLNTDEKKKEKGVSLMTVHNAKGLEFPIVFIVNLEEEAFPHLLTFNKLDQLREERRLFYVAMTRSEEKLFLSCSQRRVIMGHIRTLKVSRFIEDINEKHLKILDFSNAQNDSFYSKSEKKSFLRERFIKDDFHEYF